MTLRRELLCMIQPRQKVFQEPIQPHFGDNCQEDDECLNALIYFPEPVPALFAAVWANKKKAQRFVYRIHKM
jgi:hypothetical protein